jgi:hypothetical protein
MAAADDHATDEETGPDNSDGGDGAVAPPWFVAILPRIAFNSVRNCAPD